jgi:hypothetical protein
MTAAASRGTFYFWNRTHREWWKILDCWDGSISEQVTSFRRKGVCICIVKRAARGDSR